MKIINRGFISLKPKQAFWDWANQFTVDMPFSEADECEASIYLIDEDFFDIEPVLEKNFKKIIKNECLAVTDDEINWPEKLDMDLFNSWFICDFGTGVYDLEKSDILAEKID
jgi:hypothetical protein